MGTIRREIQVASIAWVNAIPTPLWFAGPGEKLEPAWLPRTYMLLKGTSNPAPPVKLPSVEAFQAGQQFRALTYCRCRVEVDECSGQVADVQVLSAGHDAGWSPPFRYQEFPAAQFPDLFLDPDLRDTRSYPGEASDLSGMIVQGRHKNTAIAAMPADEQVVASALLKFRAGPHTDALGIRLGSPFHVPWQWQEWVLTCAAGRFNLYTRASKFPSHACYVDGKQVAVAAGIGDAVFPKVAEPPLVIAGVKVPLPRANRPARINLPRLVLYPTVLSRGAPAGDPQTPNGAVERERQGPVDKHPNTVPGWRATVVGL